MPRRHGDLPAGRRGAGATRSRPDRFQRSVRLLLPRRAARTRWGGHDEDAVRIRFRTQLSVAARVAASGAHEVRGVHRGSVLPSRTPAPRRGRAARRRRRRDRSVTLCRA